MTRVRRSNIPLPYDTTVLNKEDDIFMKRSEILNANQLESKSSTLVKRCYGVCMLFNYNMFLSLILIGTYLFKELIYKRDGSHWWK